MLKATILLFTAIQSIGGPRHILKVYWWTLTDTQSAGGPRQILKVYWWTYITTIIGCSCSSDRYSKRSIGGPRQILKVYCWTYNTTIIGCPCSSDRYSKRSSGGPITQLMPYSCSADEQSKSTGQLTTHTAVWCYNHKLSDVTHKDRRQLCRPQLLKTLKC